MRLFATCTCDILNMQRIEATVTGRVQGVGFRQYVRERARRHGVAGWVRNEADGSVRVVAEGPAEALDALVRDLRQGPPLARVEDLQLERREVDRAFTDFSVR